MGSSLQLVNEIPAGNIGGIGGLENYLVKTGTLSTTRICPNFIKTKTISLGLVKVAIEAKSLDMMSYLKEGLEKLNRADPSV
jgi:ribosome assembly protein 1